MMRRVYLMILMLCASTAAAQRTLDLQFVLVTFDGVNYDVKLQIRASNTFEMASSTIVFTYDASALSLETSFTPHNFSSGGYNTMTQTGTAPTAQLNISHIQGQPGTTVPTGSWLDIATLYFAIINPAGQSNLQWDAAATKIYRITGGGSQEVSNNSLINMNTSPLPVELVEFAAEVGTTLQVSFHWATATETNNYGFELEMSENAASGFLTVPGSFVGGHGTTLDRHDYDLVLDVPAAGEWYFRLKQIDLDGTVHYCDPLLVRIEEESQIEASLQQNFPNPFNPKTVVSFQLPVANDVKLVVFDLLGREVAVLVNEVRNAGRHDVSFDATGLASGTYLYRLSTGTYVQTKKLTLLQ